MAVKLRLTRVGKKKQPQYRVVAADSRSPRDGRFIEIIGTYQPRLEPSAVKIDGPRALHWLRHGAQPTERVRKLLEIQGIWAAFADGTELPSGEGGAEVPGDVAATATPADVADPGAAPQPPAQGPDTAARDADTDAEASGAEGELAPMDAVTFDTDPDGDPADVTAVAPAAAALTGDAPAGAVPEAAADAGPDDPAPGAPA